MNIEQEIQRFKMELFRKLPFYGDILMRLGFVEDKRISTAATNGKTIFYNSSFLSRLTAGERNFVLMHELFHILLRHGIRNADGQRDHEIWNLACDIIINDMLLKLQSKMIRVNIPFQKPDVGAFSYINSDETAENLYGKIKADNAYKTKLTQKLKMRKSYTGAGFWSDKFEDVDLPSDIRTFELSEDELNMNDQLVREMIQTAAQKCRGTMGSYYIPAEVYTLVERKKLDWRRLLKDFLSQEIGEDSSYATPERKYLHMDMILPGHSLTDETIEEVWAFVDSSGSINRQEMAQFLTQLHHISREFKCILNICYWDTAVTDVYKKIRPKDDILKCVPHHSGGTDINCVYQWIHENRVKPGVMLILTDGLFGRLTTPTFRRQLGKKTILILSSDVMINDDMKKMGKIAKL